MNRRRALLAGLVVLASSLRGARAATGAGPAGTPALPARPRRIVSLVPSVTEILFALGAQNLLVGVTDYCDYPPEARAKPQVGGMLAPSLEAVAALRPDLVVATSAGNRLETVEQLQRLGIAVYLVSPESVADVLALIRRLGDLTSRAEAGRALAAELGRRVAEVSARVANLPRPRVLYVLWPDPLIVPGRGAIVSELIRLAGGDSVTADLAQAYPRYSAEAAIARAPEIIFLARHGHSAAAATDLVARSQWERFTGLPAIRAGRLYPVDGDLLHRYGPRLVDGLELLAKLTHPEAFPRAASAPRPAAAAPGPRP